MAFPCNKNPLLADLEAKKKALKLKIANLPSLGTGALADIQAAADDALNALKGALPEIPEIPNFQKQLDELKAQMLSGVPDNNKLLEFQKKWGGMVDGLEKTLEVFQDPLKLLDFKICDQPVVEAEADADGNLQQVPAAVEPVTDTNSPEKQDPPPAATEVGVTNTFEVIQQDTMNNTDVTTNQLQQANKELNDKILKKIIMPLTVDGKYVDTYGAKAAGAIPIGWKKQNPNAMWFEYYLDTETKPDTQTNVLINSDQVTNGYRLIKKQLQLMYNLVIKTVEGAYAKDGNPRWQNGKWNPAFEKTLQLFLYNNFGYGLKEYKPEYINYFKPKLALEKSRQYPLPMFELKKNDYKAYAQFKTQGLSEMLDGKYSAFGLQNKVGDDKLKDMLKIMFEEKIGWFGTGTKAIHIIAAHGRDMKLEDVTTDLPDWKDFLPKSLGGNLTPWEDVLVANAEIETEVGKHSASNFTPHFMYFYERKKDRWITTYADTYDKHASLASLGYKHTKDKNLFS